MGSSALSSSPTPPSTPPSKLETEGTGARGGDEVHAAERAAQATALTHLGSHLRLWIVVVAGLSLDLWSKGWAFHTLGQGGRRPLIENVLEFQTTMNPGALFGIGAGHTEVFLIASVLALGLVLWMFAQSSPRHRLVHIALGAILAGALGNMYDRVFIELVQHPPGSGKYYVPTDSPDDDWVLLQEYPPGAQEHPRRLRPHEAEQLSPPIGYVRDFIKIPTRWLGDRQLWPWVFNVADMLLVGGVGVLALRLLGERKSRRVPARSGVDASTASS